VGHLRFHDRLFVLLLLLLCTHFFRFLSFYVANFWLIVVWLKLFMIGQRISLFKPKVFDRFSVEMQIDKLSTSKATVDLKVTVTKSL